MISCPNPHYSSTAMGPVWLNVGPMWLNMQPVWLNMEPVWLNMEPLWFHMEPVWLNIRTEASAFPRASPVWEPPAPAPSEAKRENHKHSMYNP